MPRLDTLRIIGSGGANRAMEAEMKRLVRRALPGFILPKPERVDTQTLLFPFDPALAWFAVSYLRTPSRVLWDLFETDAPRLEPLYDELREFIEAERPAWLANGGTISVRVPDATGFPASGLQIRGTIKNAIIDGARAHGLDVTLDPETADAQLVARAVKGTDRFVLSLDLAGHAMHERGYRLEEGEAPLKENLAAQLLILARWDTRTEVLLDPLAGAGTIPIEAALMGIAAPLWVPPKRPAALRLPPFEDKARDKLPDLFADARPVILANEIHTPLVEVMRRNLGRAGVGDRVLSVHGDLNDLTPERLDRELTKNRRTTWPETIDAKRGLILANPPYGERLAGGRGVTDELAELYEALRDLQDRIGYRAAYIVANDDFELIYDRKYSVKKPIWNGPLRAWFLLYD